MIPLQERLYANTFKNQMFVGFTILNRQFSPALYSFLREELFVTLKNHFDSITDSEESELENKEKKDQKELDDYLDLEKQNVPGG